MLNVKYFIVVPLPLQDYLKGIVTLLSVGRGAELQYSELFDLKLSSVHASVSRC